jgi:serine/threonine protein kinase
VVSYYFLGKAQSGLHGSKYAVVMERCNGGNLATWTTQLNPKLSENTELLKNLVGQLLDAYVVCHDHRMSHRDVKVQRILYPSILRF